MRDSDIAWTHATFNPQRGCSGERCQLTKLGLCYAQNMERARGRDFKNVILTSPNNWNEPKRLEIEAAAIKKAYGVFVGSLMDFNDRQNRGWQEDFWSLTKLTPHLVYMILTKVPERYLETLPSDWNEGAVMTYTAEYSGTYGNEPLQMKAIYGEVWVKVGSVWKVLWVQETKLK